MKTSDLAPLILDCCIAFLKERPTGTRYHPESDKYIIDTHMMARIIRHSGDFRAQVTQPESVFCARLMKQLVHESVVNSAITKNRYEVIENNNFNTFSITAKRLKMFEVFRGKKPKYVEVKDDV